MALIGNLIELANIDFTKCTQDTRIFLRYSKEGRIEELNVYYNFAIKTPYVSIGDTGITNVYYSNGIYPETMPKTTVFIRSDNPVDVIEVIIPIHAKNKVIFNRVNKRNTLPISYGEVKGRNLETTNKFEVAEGVYNKSNTGSTDADKTMYSLGAGDPDTRKNLIDIRKDGSFYILKDGNSVKLQDLISAGYTDAQIDTLLANKSDTTHNHDSVYAKKEDIPEGADLSPYYKKTETDNLLAAKSDTTHNHDSVYRKSTDSYSKTQTNSLLAGKSDTTHDHDTVYRKITDSYSRTEADDIFATKSDNTHNHDTVYRKITDSYSKTDTDAKYRLISDSYTKTEVDNKLSTKSNINHNHDSTYSKLTDTYTKTEVDDRIAIATGGDDVDKNADAYSWSEDGTDRFNLTFPNENLLVRRGEYADKYLDANGSFVTSVDGTSTAADKIAVLPGETLYFIKPSTSGNGGYWRCNWYTKSGTYISRFALGAVTGEIVVPSNAYYLWASYPTNSDNKIERISLTYYVPSPDDSKIDSIPQYKGTLIEGKTAGSTNPSDYTWEKLLGSGSGSYTKNEIDDKLNKRVKIAGDIMTGELAGPVFNVGGKAAFSYDNDTQALVLSMKDSGAEVPGGHNVDIDPEQLIEFDDAPSRLNISSGLSLKTIFGRIKKTIADLKPHVFSDLDSDLNNGSTIIGLSAKGGKTLNDKITTLRECYFETATVVNNNNNGAQTTISYKKYDNGVLEVWGNAIRTMATADFTGASAPVNWGKFGVIDYPDGVVFIETEPDVIYNVWSAGVSWAASNAHSTPTSFNPLVTQIGAGARTQWIKFSVRGHWK